MIIYQLHASGRDRLDNLAKMHSKKVFSSKEKAEAEREAFKDRCCHSDEKSTKSIMDLDPDTVKISIIELDLVE